MCDSIILFFGSSAGAWVPSGPPSARNFSEIRATFMRCVAADKFRVLLPIELYNSGYLTDDEAASGLDRAPTAPELSTAATQ